MNAPVLIVRTVSVEKLATVISACTTRWPGHPLWVVSNSGRSVELRADPQIARVVPYEMGPGGFTAPIKCAHPLVALVVPVANRTGSGYANVLRASTTLRAQTRYIASYARDLRARGPLWWACHWRAELALQWLAYRLGHLWGAWLRLRFRSLNRSK